MSTFKIGFPIEYVSSFGTQPWWIRMKFELAHMASMPNMPTGQIWNSDAPGTWLRQEKQSRCHMSARTIEPCSQHSRTIETLARGSEHNGTMFATFENNRPWHVAAATSKGFVCGKIKKSHENNRPFGTCRRQDQRKKTSKSYAILSETQTLWWSI